jgi:hypothetical protein
MQEIYKTEELDESATTRKIRAVRKEGNRDVERELLYYNLDSIIAVSRFMTCEKIIFAKSQRKQREKPTIGPFKKS